MDHDHATSCMMAFGIHSSIVTWYIIRQFYCYLLCSKIVVYLYRYYTVVYLHVYIYICLLSLSSPIHSLQKLSLSSVFPQCQVAIADTTGASRSHSRTSDPKSQPGDHHPKRHWLVRFTGGWMGCWGLLGL